MASGAASLGLATIDLELPQEGNGRSVREWCEAIYAAAREHDGGKDDDDDDDDDDEQEDASVRDSKYLEVQKDASAGDNLRTTPPKSASRRTQSKELIQHEELVRAATYEGNLKGQHAKRGSMGIPLLDTNDSLEDLVAAAEYLRANHEAPRILIGHSLGGAAVLAAAHRVPESIAVATIGAPSDTGHLGDKLVRSAPELESRGQAEVRLGGRPFVVKKQLLDDLREHTLEPAIALNWIDLPEGSFTTQVARLRVIYTMSPRMFVEALTQYNSSTETFGTNVRFRWEYIPGSDLYIVYNEGRNDPFGRFPLLTNRVLAVKLTRMFRF